MIVTFFLMLLSGNFRSIFCKFYFEYFLDITVLVFLGLDCTLEGHGRLWGREGVVIQPWRAPWRGTLRAP